jgi:ABC-type transport system involved in cytochrome bd biosynthesis fused ATPase/permease subunit
MTTRRDDRMATKPMRELVVVAGLAWLVVAAYGVRSAAVADGGDWQLAYVVFMSALLVGAALSVWVAARVSRESGRPRLRTAGLAVSGVGAVACLVAWALPLWMTLLGVGFAIVAAASGPGERRAAVLLAAAQLVGVAVMFAGIATEVGRRDEWGDYPAAGGIALAVVAGITIVALLGVPAAQPASSSSRRS